MVVVVDGKVGIVLAQSSWSCPWSELGNICKIVIVIDTERHILFLSSVNALITSDVT